MGTGSRTFNKAQTQGQPSLCGEKPAVAVLTAGRQGDVTTHRNGCALALSKTHSDLEEESILAASWALRSPGSCRPF